VAYNCVVCAKQVPDTAHVTAEAMTPEGTVNRAALPAIFNPEDLHALEAALAVRDEHGGSVTVVSMGPPKAADVLREALYRGADRVILVTDRRAAASDTLATSYILSRAIHTIGNCDLIFFGRQAIDGDTAQVGPQTAEKLGIPQVTYLERVESLRDGVARMRRNIGHGWEVVEVRLPVLVTVLGSANQPRPAAAKRVMRYKRARTRLELAEEVKAALPDAGAEKQEVEVERRAEKLRARGLAIERWDLDDIKADLTWCGLSGSPTKVHRVQSIVLTKEGYTEIPPTEEGIRRLIRELIIDHTLG
jgi:electron transfer flavoprotein beta subunit